MTLRLAVLGCAGAAPLNAACSCYAVSGGGKCVLLDCGPGALERIWRFGLLSEIEAIVISHMHADHVLDLLPFAGELVQRELAGKQPALYLPNGGRQLLGELDAVSLGRRARAASKARLRSTSTVPRIACRLLIFSSRSRQALTPAPASPFALATENWRSSTARTGHPAGRSRAHPRCGSPDSRGYICDRRRDRPGAGSHDRRAGRGARAARRRATIAPHAPSSRGRQTVADSSSPALHRAGCVGTRRADLRPRLTTSEEPSET